MLVCNENKLTKNLQIFNQKFTKQHFENDIIELSVKDKKIQKQKGELKMKNLVQNKITENLKEKSKMKKFISSILLFTIIGIPMSSSVFVKAAPRTARELLDEFNYKESEGYKLITSHFGHELRHEELISVISVIQQNWPVFQDLTEDEKQDISLLYKYIEKHIDEMRPILPLICGVFDDE